MSSNNPKTDYMPELGMKPRFMPVGSLFSYSIHCVFYC